jgi:Zn-dependent protease with chaperone function
MTDFFEQQEKSRKATFGLLLLYIFSVVATCLLLHLSLCAVFSYGSSEGQGFQMEKFLEYVLMPEIALATMGITSFIIFLSSLYKITQLRAGGSAVAEELGGREITNSTQDPMERRLLNVVEEMAIASGITMPRVFVLDGERGMNAFAAGFSSKDAAIAVTRGLLEVVKRDELQAVIGHEFSHVLNGDMRLNIWLVGVLHGIFALTILGRVLIEIGLRSSSRSSSSSRKNNNPLAILALVGLASWIVGLVGFFFGRLIQSGISRQREFLADASAVQFTRNPQGLAQALKLIGAAGSNLTSPNTTEVSHMLFSSGMNSFFATHPPIETRIQRLDPFFNGDFNEARIALDARRSELVRAVSGAAESDASNSLDDLSPLNRIHPTLSIPGLEGEDASAVSALFSLAWLSQEDRVTLRTIPAAIGCICGCLLSTDEAVRERQMGMLPRLSFNDALVRQWVESWAERIRERTVSERRQVCELAVMALRNEPRDLRERLAKSVEALSSADDQIDPFEFAVGCMIRRRLLPDESLEASRRPPVPPKQLVAEILEVLSVIALYGAKEGRSILPALEAGVQRLLPFIGALPIRTIPETVDAQKLDRSLRHLEALAPLLKREFMQACEVIIMHDAEMTEVEETFLFAIADAIDALSWNAKVAKKQSA